MVYGANLNARTNRGELPIDVARNEEMKQAICDEPRRRMDHGHKRATEQERHPNVASSTTAQQENDEDEVAKELTEQQATTHRFQRNRGDQGC